MNDEDIRMGIAEIRTWLSEVERRLDARASYRGKPELPSVDDEIAAATSATQVQKALERELGIDRRTVLGRIERVVKAFRLEQRFPNYTSDLALHKYLAEKDEHGKRRLSTALAMLEPKKVAA
jgi:hypothetical protein